MNYCLKKQQRDFKKAFKGFNGNEEIFFLPAYACDYYRGEELKKIMNSKVPEFAVTMFCDALMNSALHNFSGQTLGDVSYRVHFTFNNCNIFDSSGNVTNRFPQWFLSFVDLETEKFASVVYEVTKAYFLEMYVDVGSMVPRGIDDVYVQLLRDSDIRYSGMGLDPRIVDAYMLALKEVCSELRLPEDLEEIARKWEL